MMGRSNGSKGAMERNEVEIQAPNTESASIAPAHLAENGNGAAVHAGWRALKFDAARYQRFLDDTDWTDAQKQEFTAAVWEIVVGFVDLGFGLNLIQHVSSERMLLEVDSPPMISSDNIARNMTTSAAGDVDDGPVGGKDS